MAIDMIENNDLGALAKSRLGDYHFDNEDWVYKNYTGDEEFFNLFGSRKKKVAKIESAVNTKYANLPTDCDSIQQSIDIINTDIALLLKTKPNLNQKKSLAKTNQILAEFKKAQISQNCEKVKAEAQTAKAREETLSTLTQLSDISVGKAQTELQGLNAQDAAGGATSGLGNKKLLLYGGIGLGVLLVVVILMRKK